MSPQHRTTRHLAGLLLPALVAGALAGPTPTSTAAPTLDPVGTWTRTAPESIDGLRGLTVSSGDPDRVWAVTGGDVARTTDGGATWEHGLHLGSSRAPRGSIVSVVADPDNANAVYGVDARQTILRSADGGRTGAPLAAADFSVDSIDVAIGTGGQDRLLATRQGSFGPMRASEDGGATFVDVRGSLDGALSVKAPLLDPGDQDTAYVVTGQKLLRTTDLFATPTQWASIAAAPVSGSPLALALSAGALFVLSSDGHLYRARDPRAASVSWDDLGAAVTDPLDLAADDQSVWVTGDGESVVVRDPLAAFPLLQALPVAAAGPVALSASAPGTAYLGDAERDVVRRTTDNGLSFTDVPGIVATSVTALAATDDATLALDRRGLLATADGRTWTRRSDVSDARSVVASPDGGGRVLVISSTFGLLASDDGGRTLAPVTIPQAPTGLVGIAVDPSDADVVWASARNDAVLRSGDAGRTWEVRTTLPDENFRRIVVGPDLPSSPSRVYLLDSTASTPLRVSVDDGATFAQVSVSDGFTATVIALAVDPTDSDRVVAAAGDADSCDLNLALSVNGGGSWTTTQPELTMPGEVFPACAGATLAFRPDGTLALAAGFDRVAVSRDQGRTLLPVDPEVGSSFGVPRELLSDARGLHLASSDAGVLDLVAPPPPPTPPARAATRSTLRTAFTQRTRRLALAGTVVRRDGARPACAGRVTVTVSGKVKRRGTIRSKRFARVRPRLAQKPSSCRWAMRVKMPAGTRGRTRVEARFAGTATLRPSRVVRRVRLR